jgi:phosphoribosylformylglycinamidine synthase subunit PurL
VGVAIAEMAAAGGVGAEILAEGADHRFLFAESVSTVIACVAEDDLAAVTAASTAEVSVEVLGRAGGERLRIGDVVDVAVAEVVRAWRSRIPDALGSGTSH